jgi:hypothetical protein
VVVGGAACGPSADDGDNSRSSGQDAAAEGVGLAEDGADGALFFVAVDPAEEVLLFDEDDSLLVSPLGMAPARLSVR